MSRLKLATGYSVAFQKWGAGNSKKVLCLHGWLDNSNSFNHLGKYLANNENYEVIALDHIGHGLSDHFKSMPSEHSYTSYLKCVVDALAWEQCDIVGHSMGANMSVLFAGVYPERVNRLALIEGIGPPAYHTKKLTQLVRRAVDQEHLLANKATAKKEKKLYATVQAAIESRVSIVSSYPGKQFLSVEAAAELVARGAVLKSADSNPHTDAHTHNHKHIDGGQDYADLRDRTAGPVVFRYDPKLMIPSLMLMSEEQVQAYIQAISSPTLFVSAEQGWPLIKVEERQSSFTQGLLTSLHLPGSHHLHLDPLTAPRVALEVAQFLRQNDTPGLPRSQ